MTAISGVHLGSSDCSALDARKLLGEDAIIGSTVHNLYDAIQVSEEGVSNYVGMGPYRKSKTKHDLDPILSEKIILEISSKGITKEVIILCIINSKSINFV